jgi:hypothetical protein
MICELLTHLFSGVAGGLVVICTQHWFAKRRERERDALARITKAKDNFGLFFAKLIINIPDKDILVYYDSIKASAKEVQITLWHYLEVGDRNRLDVLWKEYDEIDREKLNPENEDETARDFEKMDTGRILKHPRYILKYHLQRLYDFTA